MSCGQKRTLEGMFSLDFLSQRLRTEETLEERQGGGGLEGGHHVAGEADRGEAEVLRAGGQAEARQWAGGKPRACAMRMARECTPHAGCGAGLVCARARRTLSGAPATVYVVT